MTVLYNSNSICAVDPVNWFNYIKPFDSFDTYSNYILTNTIDPVLFICTLLLVARLVSKLTITWIETLLVWLIIAVSVYVS